MLVIGSRGSKLALWQSEWVKARLAERSIAARIEIIKTTGDKVQDRPLSEIDAFGAEQIEAETPRRIAEAAHLNPVQPLRRGYRRHPAAGDLADHGRAILILAGEIDGRQCGCIGPLRPDGPSTAARSPTSGCSLFLRSGYTSYSPSACRHQCRAAKVRGRNPTGVRRHRDGGSLFPRQKSSG